MGRRQHGRSGGLAPISFPLFQGVRLGFVDVTVSSMVVLLGYREPGACVAARRSPPQIHVGFQRFADEKTRGPAVQSVAHDPARTSPAVRCCNAAEAVSREYAQSFSADTGARSIRFTTVSPTR